MEHTHPDNATPHLTPPAAPQDLRSIGGFRVLRLLGEGGMGAVYLGYHEDRKSQVAIKVLGDHLNQKQAFVDRFYREGKTGALLHHPNIVKSLCVGQDQASSKHFLVMEYVDGPSVAHLLERLGRLAVGDAVHIALGVARALEHAHARSIVHRDIKPDNILLTRSGVAKLTDLGLAKRLDETSHLTATRQGFGTTPYMPYEQAINAKFADGRSDLYALGATLYHLLTGVVPFPGEDHAEVIEKKRDGYFLPARRLNPAVPRQLDAILKRMLTCYPRDRYQTASEVIIDLERSRLAPLVPSFADPERALLDPEVQNNLISATEPTRIDPDSPPRTPVVTPIHSESPTPALEAPPAEPVVWQLRYRNRAGQVRKYRATTEQIRDRLRQGRMPEGIEARRHDNEGYQLLSHFPELETEVRPDSRETVPHHPLQTMRHKTMAAPPLEAPPAPEKDEHGATPWWLTGASLLTLLGSLVWLAWFWLVPANGPGNSLTTGNINPPPITR
jgi:serine/threonine-protein kinase